MSNAIIHRNMSFEDYRRLPGMNQSTLTEGLRSMAHLRWAMESPDEDRGHLRLGRETHCLITEPEKFDEQFIVGGPINPTTGKCYGPDTKKFAEWMAQHPGKTAITEEQHAKAVKMASAITSLPLCEAVLSMPKLDIEVVIQWADETGVLCKCRLDLLVSYTDPRVVADWKTSQDSRPGPFGRSVAKYAYHIQNAFYVDAVRAAFGDDKPIEFLFFCVDSSEPFVPEINRLKPRDVEIGRREYKRLLAQYAECVRCGEWPGYPTDIQTVSLPRWAQEDDE
jgi:hypothetical protein